MDVNAEREASRPVVSVIIPARNAERTLGQVLDALAAQTHPRERFEVIVADNRSTDGTARVARAWEGVRVVFETETESAAAARNRGIAEARGEVFAFLDADCVPEPEWLERAVAALEREGVDLVGGEVDTRAVGGRGALLAAYDRLSYVRQGARIRETGSSATANLLVRRGVVEAVGPFRPDLAAAEDDEFCARARRGGFRIAYAEDARVCRGPAEGIRAVLRRAYRAGRMEALLPRLGVAPPRRAGSSFLSRKAEYASRVWREPGLPAAARLAILFLNGLATVAQGMGRWRGGAGTEPKAVPSRIAAVLLCVLAVSALYLRWHEPRPEVLYPDAATYMRQAQGYLEGQASIAPPWRRLSAGGPLYPALTALATPLSGNVEAAGVWVSRLAGVAIVLGAAWLGLRLGGPLAALAAGALAAVEPRLVHFSETGLTESLFMALWLGAFIWGCRILRGRTRRWEEVGLGALLGAASLTRAIGLIGIPAAAGLAAVAGLWLAREPVRAWLPRAVRIALGAALVVVPYQTVAWSNGWITAMDTHTPVALRVWQGAAKAPPSAPDAQAVAPLPASPAPVAAGEAGDAGDYLEGAEEVAAKLAGTLSRQTGEYGRLFPPLVWLLAALGLLARLSRARREEAAADLYLLGFAGLYLLALAAFGTNLARYLLALAPLVFVYAGIGVAILAAALAVPARRLLSERGAAWAGMGGALLLAAVAVAQAATIYRVPERAYPPVRALAAEVREDTALSDPVMVFADHSFMPYYLHGYWAGLPVAPERAAREAGGSRVVVLDAGHLDQWPAPWREAASRGAKAGPFRLAAQRYFPAYRALLTVYADAPPAPGHESGAALLARGELGGARRAFRAEGDVASAGRGLGAIDLILGQYFPERLAAAREHLRRAEADPGPLPPPGSDRVAWARPPGEVYAAVDEVALRWNRAVAALNAGDAPGAWPDVRALAPVLGDDPRYRYLLGLVLFRGGRVNDAIAALELARRGLPGDPGVAVATANALTAGKRFGEAAALYREVLAREPANAGVWLNLVQAQLLAGDREAARASLRSAARLELSPRQRARLEGLEGQLRTPAMPG